jgi:hypothetical protein
MPPFTRLLPAIAAAAALTGWPALGGAAQHHRGHHVHHHGRLPAYDIESETTLEGAVDELVRLQRPGCRDCDDGTHVFLSGHDVEIHLCPASFLEAHGCRLREGDRLRVTGSKVIIGGSTLLLAKSLRCGDEIVALRDDDGRPLWRRSSR